MTGYNLQSLMAYKFVHGFRWLGEVFQGDWNEDADPYQVIFGTILNFIPVYGQIADGRDTIYWLHVLMEKKEREKLENWIYLLTTAIGWIPLGGDITKTGVKLVGKATDGFKKTKVMADVLQKLFDTFKLGSFRTFFSKVDWNEIKRYKDRLKEVIENAITVMGRFNTGRDIINALEEILADYDVQMDKALQKIRDLVETPGGEEQPIIIAGRTGISNHGKIRVEYPQPPQCPICGQAFHHFHLHKKGNHQAKPAILRENMYPDGSHTRHPYWHDIGTRVHDTGTTEYRSHKNPSLQAHHLIPGAAMQTKGWKKTCKNLKYDINTKFNGVMYPGWLSLACHVKVPLHRGTHDHNENSMRYTRYTEQLIKEVKLNFKRIQNQCDSDRFITKMDETSTKIYLRISSNKLLLTRDGKDYAPSNKEGCCQEGGRENVSLPEKQQVINGGNTTCTKRRIHWYASLEEMENLEKTTGRKFFYIGS